MTSHSPDAHAPAPDVTFAGLGLADPLARACAQAGFGSPTAIQQQVVPAVLGGHDVLGLAPTGSGKTAAFALPLLHHLATTPAPAPRRVRVLVLVPTRELAAQVAEVFRALGQHLPVRPKVAVVFGGVSANPQMLALRGGADVLVATPGRLLDLRARNAVDVSRVEALVLDEADRLLDLGFQDELQQVLQAVPRERRNLLFSATFPDGIQALAAGLLQDAVRIEADTAEGQLPDIVQRAIEVDAGRRTELLRHLARQGRWRRVLVFVATRYATEHLARKLCDAGLAAGSLHGEMSQGARTDVLADFKAGRTDVLVTTDLASRGIDIPALDVVVNYDLPRSPADHVHRIGRTGRAGASGLAVSFVSAATQAQWRLIEARQGLHIAREQVPGFEPTEAAPPVPAKGAGGIKGKRPSKKDKLRAAAAEAARQRDQG